MRKRFSSMTTKMTSWIAVVLATVLGIVVATTMVTSSSAAGLGADGIMRTSSIPGPSRTPGRLAEEFLSGTAPSPGGERSNVTTVVERATTWGRFWAANPANGVRLSPRDMPPADLPVYMFLIHGDIQAEAGEPSGAAPPIVEWQVVVDEAIVPYTERMELTDSKGLSRLSWFYSIPGSPPTVFARQ
jgi:hypothetical protein